MARCKHCSGVMLSERPHASLVDCLSSAQTEIAILRAELAESKRRNMVSFETDMGPCDFVPRAQADEEIDKIELAANKERDISTELLSKTISRAEKSEAALDNASRMLTPLVGWNDRLRRGATSIPMTYENQVETVLSIIDEARALRNAKGEG